jgi:hypothetical protein
MNLQSYESHNLTILGFLSENPMSNNHFNVIPIARSKVYYKEESGGSQVQVFDNNDSKSSLWPNLAPFALPNYIV